MNNSVKIGLKKRHLNSKMLELKNIVSLLRVGENDSLLHAHARFYR